MSDRERNASPLVSVIVPAYNASATIERTLNSIIQQTYTNIGSAGGGRWLKRRYLQNCRSISRSRLTSLLNS